MSRRLLRRLAGAVPGRLFRPLSTAASRPPWAMLDMDAKLDRSAPPSPRARASLDLTEPPSASHLSIPAHFVDGDGNMGGFVDGWIFGSSGDGLLLLKFSDSRYQAPVVGNIQLSFLPHMPSVARELATSDDPDAALFICNPLSGQLYRLPAATTACYGLLTQSEGAHGPPDRYVVTGLPNCGRGEQSSGGDQRKVMRRFLSETGEWDDLEYRPSSERVGAARLMQIDHEVVAFGDRLWWVDVSWGASSLDPFSDRPDERFVELPPGSVLPDLTGLAEDRILGSYRRVGVSEGKLRYVEVSKSGKKAFVVSSFSLDEERNCWTLEHKMGITPSWASEPKARVMPSISVIDPLNANVVYLTFVKEVLAIDMAKGEVIGRSSLEGRGSGLGTCSSSFLVPCVLPPWLESSQIPSEGTLSSKKTNAEKKTLADMLVRVDRD